MHFRSVAGSLQYTLWSSRFLHNTHIIHSNSRLKFKELKPKVDFRQEGFQELHKQKYNLTLILPNKKVSPDPPQSSYIQI